jgi:hypothetical protein
MTGRELQWDRCTTLSKQTVNGRPAATEFLWATDIHGNVCIKAKRSLQKFSKEDYEAMISHVLNSRGAVPLGSRRDQGVPENSIGALMQQRRGTQSIRGWCSHLAAIAVSQNRLGFTDTGRGPGRGIFLHAKRAGHS